ncbi:Methyl-accepting chemotaxis protein 2 [Edwardsiella tarda]|nr:Methyl-accepting chemotaxis protein 2 [Edwardsiella tarda]
MYKKIINLFATSDIITAPPASTDHGDSATECALSTLPPSLPDSPADYEHTLCHCMLSGLDSITTIRNTLLSSSERLQQEQQVIDALNAKNHQAYDSMHALEKLVAEIGTRAQQEIQISAALQETVAEINYSVEDIHRLSNQTNLLAINSAIEAAHVGELGRGFTVIVKEIKHLASEVKQHASQIAGLSRAIAERAGQVCDSVASIQALINHIQREVMQSRQSLEQVIERAGYMQQIIRAIAIQQFLNTVKLDHIIWKYQVYHYLFNRDRQATMNDHQSCRLGKWYYGGEGQQLFGEHPAFRALERPHAAVHRSGQRALSAFAAGDFEAMRSALAQMEAASAAVIEGIDVLIGDTDPRGEVR